MTTEMSVRVSRQHDLLRFCEESGGRYHLDHVAYVPGRKMLVATNGRIFVAAPCDAGDSTFYVPAAMLHFLVEHGARSVIANEGDVSVPLGDAIVPIATKDARFPEVEPIFSEFTCAEDAAATALLGIDQLAPFMEYAASIDARSVEIRLPQATGGAPAVTLVLRDTEGDVMATAILKEMYKVPDA